MANIGSAENVLDQTMPEKSSEKTIKWRKDGQDPMSWFYRGKVQQEEPDVDTSNIITYKRNSGQGS